jgi:hypothetical protein
LNQSNPYPDGAERPLRFVFFGHSIVSDWQNPAAKTSRDLLRALNQLGHETRFLEERGNRAIVDLLQARGSSPLRVFARDYPDIVYRTYDLPKGLERTVWLARELGDVDVAVALDDAPRELLDELARVPLPRLVRVILHTRDHPPSFTPDVSMSLPESMSFDALGFAASLVDQVTTELIMRRKL